MSPMIDLSGTTLTTAQANVRASVEQEVAHLNEDLKTRYLSAFHDWTINVLAGKIDNSNPPKPPLGVEVGEYEDPNWPGVKWACPVPSANPVCVMPPIPDDFTHPKPPVMPQPTSLMNVPPGDMTPVGYIAIAPDGSRWQKQVSATPFGVVYYYAKIN